MSGLIEVKNRIPKYFYPAVVGSFLLSLVLFISLYFFDNKLTKDGPQAQDALLKLSAEDFSTTPVLFLRDNWGLYKDALLTPEDLYYTQPDEYINIGDYTDLSFGDNNASAHGSASYLMVIDVSEHQGDNIYTLQLPEIYSAYNLYINGELMQRVGIPEKNEFSPLITTGEITFKAKDQIEILISVTDYAHHISGMVEPPAFGDTISVNTMVQGRLVWRSILTGVVLMLGIIILLARRILCRKHRVLFSLLALSFIGYTCYTIIHAIGTSGMFLFRIQTFCYYAIFFLAIWLMGDLNRVHTKLSMAVKITDASMCILALVIPAIFLGNHKALNNFNTLVHMYKLFLLFYLTGSSFGGMFRGGKYSHVLVCGMSVFFAAEVCQLIFPKHVSVIFGNRIEISLFVMICLIGIVYTHSAITTQTLRLDKDGAEFKKVKEQHNAQLAMLTISIDDDTENGEEKEGNLS